MSEVFLTREFFERDPLTCARELIGCELVWGTAGGIVVEVEAYAEEGDEACHTFARPSARKFIAEHEAGAAYVYMNYGMHWLLNVLVKGSVNGFVLFRALQPTRGLPEMEARRRASAAKSALVYSLHGLCSGPGKLAQALDVDGRDHGRDLCAGLAATGVGFIAPALPVEVERDVRIGISKAADLQWRFLARGSEFVSVQPRARKPKAVERKPEKKAAARKKATGKNKGQTRG